MTRHVLIAIGTALLTIGGSGLAFALIWLTANKVRGMLPYIFDTHAESLLLVVPAVLLTIAIVGAVFVTSGLAAMNKDTRTARNLHPHTRFHA